MEGIQQSETPVTQSTAEQAKANLKGEYKENCKVIPGVGEFAYVIRVALPGRDANVTFQIPAEYPSSAATVRVTAKSLTQEQQEEAEHLVSGELSSLENAANLEQVVARAQEWFEANVSCPEKTDETKQRKTKSKKKKVKAVEDETKSTKKPSMKTADDVINRIQWDDALPTQNFVVGYLDRFTGLEEKPFSAFSWEDIASVDYFTLAIPRHRIQYFKYRDVKVWDKTQRLDLVFGSVGAPASVVEIVKACDEAAEGKAITSMKVPDASAESSKPRDDETELELELGSFSRLQMGQTEDSSSDNESDQRPNYFIGVRVLAESIVNAAQTVQDHMLGAEPRYAPCVIPAQCLHVTLCTVGLDSLDDITRCCDALKACRNKIASILPKGFALKLEEVQNFYDRVVYARVEPHPAFMNFVEVLKEELIDRGVSVRDQYRFVPHMTLMKTTRPVSREMHTSLVDSSLYEGFKKLDFGEQPVTAIELCQMGDARGEDGFYLSPLHLPLYDE